MTEIPLVWLCGPPGVGKTAVAWAVYQRLVGDGVAAAYVDVDQLGMCYPEPPDDSDRHRLKARNVQALRTNFAASGAMCLIVSGVVDPGRGPELALLGQPIVVGRLRADLEELAARLGVRRGSFADPDVVAQEARLLDTSHFADWCLDTTSRAVDDLATEVLDTLGGAVRQEVEGARAAPAASGGTASAVQAGGQVLWLAGPTGVGKSTVGFLAYRTVLGAGVPAAFIDVDQLIFFESGPNELRARNLASVWANHHVAGAEVLVVVGQVEAPAVMQSYEEALAGATFTWCRLHAGSAELTRRVLSRRDGGSWPQPGDPLKGQPPERLVEVAHEAIAQAARLDASATGLRVDVDQLSPEEAAAAVLEATAWPRAPDRSTAGAVIHASVIGEFTTERLRLRPLTLNDARLLSDLNSDVEVMRYITGRPSSPEEVEAEIEHALDTRWLVFDRSTGEFLGWVGAISTEDGEFDVGWRFRRVAWGRGLATEAARALIDRLFASGVTRVFAQTMAVNDRSRAVMERLGLRIVRTFHIDFDDPLPGSELGEVEYELELREWQARQR